MKDLLLLLRAAITAILVATANCQTACTTGDVRLVGGSSNLEGRVEVCNEAGLWGTVCDDGWTEVDANVVCGQLGHSHEDAVARTGAYFGQGSGGIYLDDVDCAGFEDRLIDCDHRGLGVHDCNHYEDAGVVCQQGVNVTFVKDDFTGIDTSIEAIRLVNGLSASMGRLELLYNGTWGTVCDTFWSYSDAKVACRMLDYDDAVCAVTYNEFGIASSSVPFWMSRVQCVGSEEALDSCSFPGWGNAYYCRHSSNDAGIVCANISEIGVPYDIQMTNSTTRTISLSWRVPKLPEGLRNVRFTISYTSEHSLDSSSTNFIAERPNGSVVREGDIVTRTLYSLQRSTAYDIQISTSVQYSACSSYYPGNYSDTVRLRTSNITRESNISVRLISPYSGVDFLGRVEVYYDGQWGTVCDDYFSTSEANVICGMLNFSAARCVVRYARYGQGSGPVWLGNLRCSGSDEVIEDCYNDGWGITYCSHYEDVGVICQPNDFPAVQNVVASSTGASSVTLRWTRYTSFPYGASSTGLDIIYGYDSSRRTVTASSTATEYTLSNLRFDREYSIRVRPKVQYSYCSYIYGPYSNEVNITTMETAPSGPPSLFHIEAINESAIEAQWELPKASERNGIIRGYKLFVLTNGRPDVVINITNNDTLVYIIGGLESRRAYTVSVLAYTVADGPRSIHLTAVTRQRDHSLIAGFGINADGVDKVTRYTYNSPFSVQCVPSMTTNTSIQWFFANGSRIGTSYFSNIRQLLYSNGTNVLTIGSGSRLTNCDGGMFACVVNDTSGRTERRTFHLVIGSSPPTPSRPTVLRQSGNKVTIGWLLSGCLGGHVPSYFTIRYRRTSYYYSSYSYITVRDPTQRSYEVTGLRYSTSYYFYIQVTTTDSRTSSYSSSSYITTLSSPPPPPSVVTVSLIRPLLVEVSWSVPAYSGSIYQYTVLATPVSPPNKRKRKRQTTTAEVIEKVFPGNTTSTEITLTHHSITYTFQVSAASRSGLTLNEGDLSSVTAGSILYVPEPGLPKPSNVRITETTNTSLTIGWNYPLPPADPISNFYITYSAEVEWRSLSGNLVQFTDMGETTVNSTQVTFSPLVPGTNYLIKVSAISSRGRGEEVMPSEDVRTLYSIERLAFFQLRLFPVVNCHSFLNQGENITEKLLTIRREIVRVILILCPNCGFTTLNMRDDEFSCRGGLTNHVVYRAMILGTSHYSPTAFVSLIQSWVRSGVASITLQSARLYLDQDCSVSLDSLRDSDCPFVTTEPPPTTNTPTTTPTVKTTTASTPTTTETRVVSGQASNQINGIDIGGFVLAVVIIVLMSALLIVIIILALKWKAGKKKSNAYSVVSQPLSGTCSTDQLHKESTNADDDHKEEYTL